MAAETQERTVPCVFERGSTVHAYWVERCAGFAVVDAHGREVGRVRRADCDQAELVVAGRLRSRRIAMAAVHSVLPRDSIIRVPELTRAASGVFAPSRGAHDDTLPWFDLVAADSGAQETNGSAFRRMRQRSQRVRHTMEARVRDAAGSALVYTRRRSSAFHAQVKRLSVEARRWCARGLIRLAGVVDPSENAPEEAVRRRLARSPE